ncbi:hypothetical protein HUJ05_013126 [Dendroctonus ponderosae]|nr:hypothetical protein HUJ05_013126 [Dendroctonus ponderosae]
MVLILIGEIPNPVQTPPTVQLDEVTYGLVYVEAGMPPMKMIVNLSENWKFWRQRFQTYMLATEVSKKAEITQCVQLLTLIGDEEEINRIQPLLRKFDEHFTLKKNLTFVRHKFLAYKQTENETVEQFITELRNLAIPCEFGDLKDGLVKDILICGVSSAELREKLLQNDVAILDEASKMYISTQSCKERYR